MAGWEFLTVADELLLPAIATAEYYGRLGYAVVAEPHELGYPFTPTLRCRRQSTTLLVEVAMAPPLGRLAEWVAYGRSARGDTRIILAVPDRVTLTTRSQMGLKTIGVGLVIASDESAVEAMPAQDLAVNVELPDISRGSRRLRAALGPVYEQFERNQWREGFEDACIALETAARVYLWKTLEAGRTVVLTRNGRVARLRKSRVMSMTIGQLAVDYANMQQQNHSDSLIAKALKTVNRDRVRVAHKKRSAAAERALRSNVGQQMWTIVGALRVLYP